MIPYNQQELHSRGYVGTRTEREFLRCGELYYSQSQPILHKMGELRLMFTAYRMVFGPDGKCIEDTQSWNDPKAESLYRAYEETLRLLRCNIFGRDTEGNRIS